MPVEHFLFGLDQDGYYFLLKSPGVNAILSDANLLILRTNHQNDSEPLWLPTEQVVVIQYITEITRNGRTGFWNHTLLFPIDEYIRLTKPVSLFSTLFYTRPTEVPLRLEPLTLEVPP